MYSNDNHFTKDPFEDNGRCQIHPLSREGIEAYLSKDSYNYNFIKTKKNPELLKEIQEEIKAENAKKEQVEKQNQENKIHEENKQEELKEEKNNSTGVKSGNDNKPKEKKPNMKNKNNNSKNKIRKGVINNKDNKDNKKKNENLKRKQSPGSKLANTIGKLGKVSGPVISNVNNDRGKLWEYPKPFHA